MSDTEPKIPKSLADALKAGNVVPFVGAGVSMSVKRKNEDGTESDKSLFPSWKGFVEILAQALRDEHKNEDADYVLSSVNIPKPKYLEVLQHAKEELNGPLWHQLFEESFSKSKDEAYPDSFRLNELIWKLANNLIITTNVDRVFQWLCPKPSEFTLLDVQSVEYAKLRIEKVPKRPTVWYLHGHIDNKDKVIFTREQFNDFYKQSGNEAKLQTLFDTLTERPIILSDSVSMTHTCAKFSKTFAKLTKTVQVIFTSYFVNATFQAQISRNMLRQFPFPTSENL